MIWDLINHNPKYECNFTNILTSFIHLPTTPNFHIRHKSWPHHHFPLYNVKSFSSHLTSRTLPRDPMAHIAPQTSFFVRTFLVGAGAWGGIWSGQFLKPPSETTFPRPSLSTIKILKQLTTSSCSQTWFTFDHLLSLQRHYPRPLHVTSSIQSAVTYLLFI